MALYCHAQAFAADGRPSFHCEQCAQAKSLLRLRGCGKLAQYRGKMQLKTAGPWDLHGTCPVYWRTTEWAQDIVTWSRWRNNLGHPVFWPNVLFEALTWLDVLLEQAQVQRLEQRAREKGAGQ